MKIMMTFLSMCLMKPSYQIHDNFMNNFLMKYSWKYPNELFISISYGNNDIVSIDILMKPSHQIHDNFMNNFFMKYSWKFPNELSISISYEFHDIVSIDMLMKPSYQIHDNFMNNFLMKYSWKYPSELFTSIPYEYHDQTVFCSMCGILIHPILCRTVGLTAKMTPQLKSK